MSFIAALCLAGVHLFADRLRALEGQPRNVWLSASGGLSVAFVFLYLLPELTRKQQNIERSGNQAILDFLDHHVYLLALSGMVAFYGLERLAKRIGRQDQTEQSRRERTFWAHLASFSIYNLVIGHMLVGEASSLRSLAIFLLAMALHFLVIDFSFREHYKSVYHTKGRWILASAIVAGWLAGVSLDIPELAVSVATAFVAGGIILNALKEELPEERQSRFWPFLVGAALYAAVALTHSNWS